MKCSGERVVRFLVCLQVVRPFPVISTVRRRNFREQRRSFRLHCACSLLCSRFVPRSPPVPSEKTFRQRTACLSPIVVLSGALRSLDRAYLLRLSHIFCRSLHSTAAVAKSYVFGMWRVAPSGDNEAEDAKVAVDVRFTNIHSVRLFVLIVRRIQPLPHTRVSWAGYLNAF